MAQQDTDREACSNLHRPVYCKHYACRCARAEELAEMGRYWEAIQVHEQEVRCRQEKEND
jgi:hypothetical protein